MSRTPAKFHQADIARALRAVKQCDLPMEVVLEPDGRIRIVPTEVAKKVDQPKEFTL